MPTGSPSISPAGDGGGWVPGEDDEVREATADERVDVDALDAARAVRVAVVGIVHRQRRESRGDKQVVGPQNLLDPVVHVGAHPLIAEHVPRAEPVSLVDPA
jgi:hypothetical protein